MLAHKAVRTGYYCPFMNEESPGPAELSFGTLALRAQWGVDIIGLYPLRERKIL
jgi:hypothetical protein